MATRGDELEGFKTGINLTAYAAGQGYELDRKASSRNSAVMVHPDGDKIVVALGTDGHWIYFSVRNGSDNGSIVDFVQNRGGGSLGRVRQVLRPWVDGPPPLPHPLTPGSYAPTLLPVTRDLAAVQQRLAAMAPAAGDDPYLVTARRIPTAVITHSRFEGRILHDERGNAVFPHFNLDGVCGYEKKNEGFTGFASGGIKGLWASRTTAKDDRLVVAETAIDALSFAALKGLEGTRFVSIAGQMNPEQPAILGRAMERMSPGSRVVVAIDHDAGGDELNGRISAVFRDVGRQDLKLELDRPAAQGQDWNDVLRATSPPSR